MGAMRFRSAGARSVEPRPGLLAFDGLPRAYRLAGFEELDPEVRQQLDPVEQRKLIKLVVRELLCPSVRLHDYGLVEILHRGPVLVEALAARHQLELAHDHLESCVLREHALRQRFNLALACFRRPHFLQPQAGRTRSGRCFRIPPIQHAAPGNATISVDDTVNGFRVCQTAKEMVSRQDGRRREQEPPVEVKRNERQRPEYVEMGLDPTTGEVNEQR